MRRVWPVLIGLLLVACDAAPLTPSPTEPPREATTTTVPETVTTVGAAEGAQLFGECMSARGIELGSVPIDAQGRPRLDIAMREVDLTETSTVDALDECSMHLVTGALAMGDSVVREAVMSRLGQFSECMRERGVPDFPDPVAGFHGIGFPFPVNEVPFEDPDLADAVEACRVRLIPE